MKPASPGADDAAIDAPSVSSTRSADEPRSAQVNRDATAVITRVSDTMVEVLGWRPEQLLGRPSIDFIHHEDQPSAIAAWFTMLNAPGDTRVWRGRYQAADGTWRWVESINRNKLDDPDDPVVVSVLTLISVDEICIEEELRTRQQLLSRLSDALPVGLFQIDLNRRITFTNDRLHTIVCCGPAATLDAQFAAVAPDDVAQLDAAVEAVLTDQPVDDIEIRLRPATEPGRSGDVERVCAFAMRALTDRAGTVTGAIGCVSDVTERVQLRRELEHRATTDHLTACLNRAATLDLLAVTLAHHDQAGGTAVVFIDLDRFKTVNDRFGHAAGDRLLLIAAQRLRAAGRDGDHVGRVGGDEFLVICPAVADAATALAIGNRLLASLTATIRVATHSVDLRASVGVAWTAGPVDPDVLIAQADNAMYRSKATHASTATLHVTDVHVPTRRDAMQL